jgi:Zn-dependent protease
VLYALGDPISLVLLLVSFLVAVTVHGAASAVAAARVGERAPAAEGRRSLRPDRHVDPFGALGAAIAGVGWAKPVVVPLRRGRRGPWVASLLAGPVATLLVGLAALGGYRAAGGAPLRGGLFTALQSGVSGDLGLRALFLLGLSCLFVGVLSLVPLPPLNGGQLLFGLAPGTPGWRKAEYQLVERNIGVAVLLALLLIPLAGRTALVPTLLDIVVSPIATAVIGG